MKIETLCEITQEIRDIISESIASTSDYGELVTVRPRDITRKIDLVAENALDEALRAREISARIISEELGDRTVGRDPEVLLVFDPVDGSTNATCGIHSSAHRLHSLKRREVQASTMLRWQR